jgi:DDE superfamily endonuclease/Helix-turn-helix of DDE superfamily endonuclease
MSKHGLITVSDSLRHRRAVVGTRWRRLSAGRQALLVMAHLRKGETYADLAAGFAIGTTTVFCYIREALDVLAALAPTLRDAVTVAGRKAFVIVDGTLLRIDRVGVASGRDRPYYSGKHKCHGVNVQVIADPAGRLIWASPALPGARHDMGAAHEHGILDALRDAGIPVIADNGYRGSGFEVPHRRRRRDPARPARQRLSHNQRAVNTAHARLRGPGERADAQLKTWKILRKIRCCPRRTTDLVKAILVLIHAG